MKKRNFFVTVITVISLFVCLMGCGNTDITPSSNPDVSTETIVSVAPNLTEIVCALGKEDSLVARSNSCDYPETVKDLPSVGDFYAPDIEKIVSLSPDLVLISDVMNEDDIQKLESLGTRVLVLNDSTTLSGVYNMISELGNEIDKKSEAEAIINDMKKSIDETISKTEGLEKPTVYYVIGYGEGGDYTATGDTFISDILNTAGAINIAQDGTSWYYSLEQLIANDPDIIIINEAMKEDFLNCESYKMLTAVKENKVFGIDSSLLDRQGPRNADAVKEIAKILHPEAFN